MSLEITRRCNLRCGHCCRGEPQPVNMDMKALRRYLKDVEEITSMCIVGGEPSLNVPGIVNVVDIIRSEGIRLWGAAIITNGINLKEDFFKAVQYLFHTTEYPKNCIFLMSLSPWHIASRLELGLPQPWPEYAQFMMEDLRGCVDWGTELPQGVCAEGRGKLIAGATNFKEPTTYINAYGEEFDSATYSYETQERLKKEWEDELQRRRQNHGADVCRRAASFELKG